MNIIIANGDQADVIWLNDNNNNGDDNDEAAK